MTTYRFQEVKARASHGGKCPVCGKRVSRSRTFTQTINPFNRNEDGSVKTPAEVRVAVDAEANAWEPDFTHEACEVSS